MLTQWFSRRSITGCAAFVLLCGGASAQQSLTPLYANFQHPPASARPRVWWHWMNGNITEEGIKLDLEWMKRVGIGGFQNFDAALATPLVIDHRVAYMTPEWKRDFVYATKLADQLGLEESIAASPGWSETGGPWVPAAEAMKKYVWSETRVEGGKPFKGTLIHPPTETGPIQNLKDNPSNAAPFYRDTAVIAYRAPVDEASVTSLHPKVTSSMGSIPAALLSDGDLNEMVSLPRSVPGGTAWIQYEFPAPQTIQAMTILVDRLGRTDDPSELLESSADGVTFKQVAVVPDGGTKEHTVSFAPATAQFFRITFLASKAAPGSPAASAPIHISELVLLPEARINRFEEKAGFPWPANHVADLASLPTPSIPVSEAINKNDIVDLTSAMHPDGSLDWTPPPGRWIVLRFGYSLLGVTNHPATQEATGLEVDKMNATYVKHYMDQYLDSYQKTVGADMMGKRGIQYVVTDSWEARSQNWTDNMMEEFTRRRGYDPRPWMPALTGRIVESSVASDRFLWDFRKTIADLIAENHYGQVAASLKQRNMGVYGESHEGGRAFLGDGMEVKKYTSVPMGAMWVRDLNNFKEQSGYNADDRESASVAHIYGQNLVAAESMTAAVSPWAWSPATLKPTVDQEFLNGINRIVVHCSTHQPLVDKAPGLGLGIYGQWFNRNETWAEEAGPWVEYIARTSYLLQQGRFSADFVYFYGEDSNLTQIYDLHGPNLPAAFGFDYINADGLIHELSVKDGQLVTRTGMTYHLLGLDPNSGHMSLPVLRAIQQLVIAGATVVGPAPIEDPSLADDQTEFKKISAALFGDGHSVQHLGKGTVFAGHDLAAVFAELHIQPDFAFTKPEPDTKLAQIHRKLPQSDLYFVSNRNNREEQVDATFRITGKVPELWHPETGTRQPITYSIANGHTTIPLKLDPWGSVFVVFSNPARATTLKVPATVERPLQTLSGPWKLTFQPNRGAPASARFTNLMPWNESSNPGIRYFSGTATYRKTLTIPSDWTSAKGALWLDLGVVDNLAEIIVNGKSLGIEWHAPYKIDITQAARAGENDLSIKVTNSWVNRLIGDQQPGAQQITFSVIKPYQADSPLLPSGLLGPVRLLQTTSPMLGPR